MKGIGVDMADSRRFIPWLGDEKKLLRYFSPGEIADCRAMAPFAEDGGGVRRRKSSAASLAARFAAKEALGKAFGSGMKGLALRDIEVVKNPEGAPVFGLRGSAEKRFRDSGASALHLSLSHEGDYAVAMVVIE